MNNQNGFSLISLIIVVGFIALLVWGWGRLGGLEGLESRLDQGEREIDSATGAADMQRSYNQRLQNLQELGEPAVDYGSVDENE